jgi:hypothetical protein
MATQLHKNANEVTITLATAQKIIGIELRCGESSA